MTIQILFGMVCTNCGKWLSDPNGGDALHETVAEMKEAANKAGWTVAKKVPNGSMWDFCPRCSVKEEEKDGGR